MNFEFEEGNEKLENLASGAEWSAITIDSAAMMQARTERVNKVAELQKQYVAEVNTVKQKFADILSEYRSACDDLNRKIGEFDKEWAPKISDYEREVKSLRKKYNKLIKSL